MFFKNKKKISLVLSGGGARGFFHVGVIRALKELNFEIEEISGTSAGAIVGAIYAAYPDFNFDKLVEDINLFRFLDLVFIRNDIRTIKKIEEILKNYIKIRDFKDFKIRFSFNATNIDTGEEIIFNKGKIFPAIISSMAIPFIFPVIKNDNLNLVDGGLVNNLPISLIKNNKNIIITSNLSHIIPKIKYTKDPISVLTNTFLIILKEKAETAINIAKINKYNIVELNLDKYFSVFDFRKKSVKELIDIGYKTTMKKFNSKIAKY
jgi:NTE family protein